MMTVSVQKLATIFVEIADTLIDEFDVLDYMHMITERVADLTAAPAVGMLLADQQGRLEFVAGSNENITLVELFVVQNQEGPCLESFRTGEPVVNVDLDTAGGRWPPGSSRHLPGCQFAGQAGGRQVWWQVGL